MFNKKGFIALLDFEKAFDTVDIEFLLCALEKYKFGPSFRKWIQVLYTQISSCVINNGHSTEFFSVTRGIRQGCPISAMLFLIVVELLSVYIKNCPDIKGLLIDNTLYTITQLADDTTIFLENARSVENLMHVMDRFYLCSGLRLNKQKSEVFLLGSCGQCNNTPNKIGGLKCSVEPFKALGIYFSKDPDQAFELNFTRKLSSCKISLNVWAQRSLSIKGKILILKSIIIPNLLYVSSNLYTPDSFISESSDLLYNFIWSNKPPKIKKHTIISDIEEGGLRMPHFPTIVQTSKIMWVKKLLSAEYGQWKELAFKLANVTTFDLCCKNDAKYMYTPFLFYKQMLNSWYNFHSAEPQNKEEIMREIVWNNKFICVNKMPVLYKRWKQKGILYIGHLFSPKGKMYTCNEIKDKYHIKFNDMEYLSLARAIPKEWHRKLKQCDNVITPDDTNVLLNAVNKLNSQKVYWNLLGKITKQPTSIDYWISEFPFLHDDDFREIYKISKVVSEVRIQSFQYKLLNRIFPCKHNLCKWGISNSPFCTMCNSLDTIEHHLYYCEDANRFWKSLEHWIKTLYKVNIPLKITDIMFGIVHMKTQDCLIPMLNYLILYGKWFIYTAKRECKDLSFCRFLKYIKYTLSIEHQVAINKGNARSFLSQWSLVIDNL